MTSIAHHLRRRLLLLLLAGAVGAAVAVPVFGQGLLDRIGSRTLGGKLPFTPWSDEVVYNDYRIQKHAVIGHYRLLSPDDKQLAFGAYETCRERLDELRENGEIPALPKHVVLILHGLGAGRQYMQGLADHLEREGNFATVNIGYPSTLRTIEEHANSLASIIRNLDGVETVDFVAHSMGNLVVRKYLYDLQQLDPSSRPPVEFRRMVMISPPNHGARAADDWVDTNLGKLVAGKPLDQLAPDRDWPDLEARLATPDFEFGIIAGGRADDSGYLPTIPGDDDGLLSIETMRLAGANDFIQTKGLHQLMARYKQVRQYALAYLQNGFFISEEARQPVAK